MQVQIPKKELDDLVEQYGCSPEEAAHAWLSAKADADEAFQSTLNRNLGKRKEQGWEAPSIYTPAQIREHLDKYIIGQDEYKTRLCIAASYHFAMLKHLKENPNSEVVRFRKKNTLIAGPSGSGKTYCAEVLGDQLGVPTLIIDSTDYTESGYVGKSADDMIRELIDMAPGDSRADQVRFVSRYGGIIFIDEIDKKAKDGSLVGHDISREGFQRSVLKLMERKLVPVDNPNSAASQIQEAMERSRNAVKKEKMISTGNILFILGGSFERNVDNLETLIKKRVERKGNMKDDGTLVVQGFNPKDASPDKDKYKNYFKRAESEDYIRFGLLPELVGRAPIRTFVNMLSKNDLIRIMTETADSILDQYKTEFSLFGITLEITDDAIDYVAEEAHNRKTGARALVSVWENILTDFQFALPGSNFTKLEVDRNLCERPRDALLKLFETSPFVDFIEGFRREYGVRLEFGPGVETFFREKASKENAELSSTIKQSLAGASALNYMDVESPYLITIEMLEDPHYFDKLFTQWHEKQMGQGE